MKSGLNLLPDYILEGDLVAVPDHLDMPDLQDYLGEFLSLEIASLDVADVSRLKGLIGIHYLLPTLFLD